MQLTEVRLENVRSFSGPRLVDLNFGAADPLPKWIVIAGRNGAGKSTFLQAIAAAVCGPAASRVLAETYAGWISDGCDEASCAVHLRATDGVDGFQSGGRRPRFEPWAALRWLAQETGPEPALQQTRVGGNWTPTRGPWADNPTGWFLAGYGPFRRLSPAPTEAQRLMMIRGRPASLASLFREDASLSESVLWLQQVYLRRLELDPSSQRLEDLVLMLLGDGLLPEGLRVERVTSEGLWVRAVDGSGLPLNALSDGYRTTAALVLDLVKLLYDWFGDLTTEVIDGEVRVTNEGVVLIDEIDVHLHVSWQKEIGFWLRAHFPNIQFIVTTHSPFICQAADVGGLVRLPAPGEDRPAEIISGEVFNRVVNGSADDAILTELFGLETPLSGRAVRLREELARFEALAVRDDLDDDQRRILAELRVRVPRTMSSDVALALGELQHKLR